MFGLGMMEILMILAIALIVVGPQKLPELAKTLGRAMGEFKRSAQDLKRSMDVETTVKEIDITKTDVNDVLKQNGSNSDTMSGGSAASPVQTPDTDPDPAGPTLNETEAADSPSSPAVPDSDTDTDSKSQGQS